MRLERLSLDEWADALPDRGVEVFHSAPALSVLDDHAVGSLELLCGFKGDRPTALLPLFVRSLPVGRVVTSPPPGFGVSRLGPVIMPASPKRRKQEKVNRKFTELVVDELDLDRSTTFVNVSCQSEFRDPRPFVWKDMGLETQFTYQIDVSDNSPDELLTNASKSLRREIRDADDLDVVVEREGAEAARRVYEETRQRYADQERSFPLTWPYVRDMIDALDDMARVYVARTTDGEFLTGITVLYSPERGYFWQGGGRMVHDGVAINSLIHWRIVEDIATDPPRESVTTYDLYGANTERLCQYKSKFGADLVPYYVVDSGGVRTDVAKYVYNTVMR